MSARPPGSTSALLLPTLAGALLAGQARLNGALAERLGTAVVAALVSFTVGSLALLLLVLVTGRWRPLAAARRQTSWWHWLGGLGGVAVVGIAAIAVPVTGVALLVVAIVAGQTAGSLVVDGLGLGPGGVRPLTGPRFVGAALAACAPVLAALDAPRGAAPAGLLLLAVLAGVAAAVQQAANGRLAEVSGQPIAAATTSFLVGTTALALITLGLALAGTLGELSWPAPSPLYLGGLGGAAYIALSAAAVGRLGVLAVTLAVVAGQVAGALLLDITVPATARPGPLTALAVVLTVLAVTIAARGATPTPAAARRQPPSRP